MSKKNALILGGSGQDGAFLAQEYLKLGFGVFSVSRSATSRMEALGVKQFVKNFLEDTDITAILKESQPELVANLASASSVAFCESNPEISKKINLDAVLQLSHSVENYAAEKEKIIKFIQASSSEMFGEGDQSCTETTLMNPVTIYGKHKHDAHEFIVNRNAKNIEYKSVILFNHESEYRTENFVSRKVARSAAEVKTFGKTTIQFGNLESKRDWGFAGDYMNALALISDQGESNCYVVASGKTYSIKEMLTAAFAHIGEPQFKKYVSVNSELFRTTETPPKVGIAEKCRNELNWQPSLSFEQLVARLVNYQIQDIQRGFSG